jgi:hypothetical protein
LEGGGGEEDFGHVGEYKGMDTPPLHPDETISSSKYSVVV